MKSLKHLKFLQITDRSVMWGSDLDFYINSILIIESKWVHVLIINSGYREVS